MLNNTSYSAFKISAKIPGVASVRSIAALDKHSIDKHNTGKDASSKKHM
jgi:hypothetical protein